MKIALLSLLVGVALYVLLYASDPVRGVEPQYARWKAKEIAW